MPGERVWRLRSAKQPGELRCSAALSPGPLIDPFLPWDYSLLLSGRRKNQSSINPGLVPERLKRAPRLCYDGISWDCNPS
jgi:hypothetical protein